MSHGRYTSPLAIILLVSGAHAADIYVDDDAPNDPGQRDPNISDPLEDGSPEHPFDAIQEAIDAAESGDNIVIVRGEYAGTGNNSFVIDQAGGFTLSITGIDGALETVIDCDRIASGFHVIGDAADPGHTAISGLTIANAFATVGAGIHTSSAARMSIADCDILDCIAADNGGGLSVTEDSVVAVTNTKFEGNICHDSGAGANVTRSWVTFDRCRFVQNASIHLGGGCLLRQSTAVIRDCTFDGNVANQGGGLHSFANNTTVIGCDFTSNAAVMGAFATIGGGANVVASEATFVDCNFSSNSAAFRGGGMMITFSAEYGVGSTATTDRCVFFNNSAGDGAGAFVTSSDGRFESCSFSNNHANDDGGGIGSSSGGGIAPTRVTVSASDFIENNAGDDGGALYLRLSHVSLRSVDFTENAADGAGGALLLAWSPDAVIDACTFLWNGALHGGAAHFQNAIGRITDCDFDGNTAIGDGGALSFTSSWFTVLRSAISDNFAGDRGGGTYAYSGTLDLVSSLVDGNSAEDGGGGSSFELRALSDMTNCVYASNSTGAEGGAIRVFDGPTIDIDDSTFASNSAANGGGIAADDDGMPAFVFIDNSVLWGNVGGPALVNGASGVTIEFSCVEGGWFGDGNISTDPLFINTIADDYHLASGSACIDVGADGRLPADREDLDGDGDREEPLPFDFDGRLRIVQGRGNRPQLDMGAYEYQLSGDVDSDGIVDFNDLLVILGAWGPCPLPCPPICPGDANSDCLVDFEDLLLVLANWS